MSDSALASRQQLNDFQLSGAYPELEQLIGLHRFCRDLKLSRQRSRPSLLGGEWQSRRRGRGIDFDEVRRYQPGDDIRSIDWRVTARTQQPHTKLYREEQERPVLLAADLRSPMFFGTQHCFKSVLCCALTSALAWITLANRDRIGGIAFGDHDHYQVRPKRSKHSVLEWIRLQQQLAGQLTTPCPATPSQSLSPMLTQLRSISRPGSAIYIASDFHDLDDHSGQQLYQLARHCDLTLMLLHDPLEQQLPTGEPLWITDGQQRRVLTRNGESSLLERRLDKLQQLCTPLAIPVQTFSTGQPLLPQLYRLYGPQRRGR